MSPTPTGVDRETYQDDPTSEGTDRLEEARIELGLSRRSMVRGTSNIDIDAADGSMLPAEAATHPATHECIDPSTGSRLVLLGTRAGPPPTPNQAGISSALVVNGTTYLVDCGRSSLTQYMLAGLRMDSLRAMFITHLHADHISDYYNYILHGAVVPNNEDDIIASPVEVYGPGPAGGLPPAFRGGEPPTIATNNPTPGIRSMTNQLHKAYAYGTNIFLRDGVRNPRALFAVNEIKLPDVGATYQNTAPTMQPFEIYRDENVVVSSILVPHGPVFPSFAFRFDTEYGSVTFSGDTPKTPNIPTLAQDTDILVHEALRIDPATIPDWLAYHHLESHVMVEEIGPIAEAARANTLVLSHTSDLTCDPIDASYWTHHAGRGYSGKVFMGRDLQTFDLPNGVAVEPHPSRPNS